MTSREVPEANVSSTAAEAKSLSLLVSVRSPGFKLRPIFSFPSAHWSRSDSRRQGRGALQVLIPARTKAELFKAKKARHNSAGKAAGLASFGVATSSKSLLEAPKPAMWLQ